MKLLTEYLERAVSLEQFAAGEQDSKFKEDLLRQAAAYRKLAAKRASDYAYLAEPARNFELRRPSGASRPRARNDFPAIGTIAVTAVVLFTNCDIPTS